MKKGFSALIWMAIIFTFLTISVFIAVFSFRYRIAVEVQFEYNYDNTQLALLNFLSSTQNSKKVSEILAEYISMNKPIDQNVLKDRLDKFLMQGTASEENKEECYNFIMGEKLSIPDKKCDQVIYSAVAKIPLPYNPTKLVEEVKLVVG